MDQLFRTLIALVDSIEDCLAKGRHIPALVLIYSSIDVLARLEAPSDSPVRQTFETWVTQYLLKQNNFAFSAVDLYAARCGILHELSVDSTLTRGNRAKRIVYATGTATAKTLQDNVNFAGLDCFAVNLGDLNQALRNAIGDYVGEVIKDASRTQAVKAALQFWFTNIPA